MILMVGLGAVLVVGLVVTMLWGGTAYEPWARGPAGAESPDALAVMPARSVAPGYLRGAAIALVGGFWAGALVTGPPCA